MKLNKKMNNYVKKKSFVFLKQIDSCPSPRVI